MKMCQLILLFCLVPSVATADLVTILNHSFESPVVADGAFTNSIDNWMVGGPAGVFNPVGGVTYSGPGTTDGEQTAFGDQGAFISQILSVNLTPNTVYTLQVDLGDRLDTEFAPYSVGLYAGGNLLIEDASTLMPNDGFLTSMVNYTAFAGDPFLGQPLQIGCRFQRSTSEFRQRATIRRHDSRTGWNNILSSVGTLSTLSSTLLMRGQLDRSGLAKIPRFGVLRPGGALDAVRAAFTITETIQSGTWLPQSKSNNHFPEMQYRCEKLRRIMRSPTTAGDALNPSPSFDWPNRENSSPGSKT